METIDEHRRQDAERQARPETGELLRNARVEAGLDLVEVARVLRIRPPYLQAIEDGRYQDLPGSAYVLGFIRAYSQYLGLDAEEIVRRFKQESEGALQRQPELVFPAPISDGQLPTASILIAGLLIAGLAYGAWYYLSSGDTAKELVSDLPERLATEVVPPQPAPEPEPEETAAPASLPPAAVAPEPQLETAPAPAPAPAEPAVTEPPAGEPAADAAAESAPVAAETTEEISASEAAPEPEAPRESAESAPEEPNAAEPPRDAAEDETAAPRRAVGLALPAPPEKPVLPQPEDDAGPAETDLNGVPVAPEAAESEPRVFGRANIDSRITIKALGEAWIQVRDTDNRLLLTRLLRQGDSYLVPNRTGLTLITGSAGDLEIFVDGEKAPPLGAPGVVRRGVPLDPEVLMRGR